jgi:hypothetical protein
MTFQEALEATKSLTLYEDTTHTEFVLAAMAEQIESNRLAIEELRKDFELHYHRADGLNSSKPKH